MTRSLRIVTPSSQWRVLALALFIAVWLPVATGASEGKTENGQHFTFVQLCDPQGNWKNFETAVRQINHLKPDFVLICGDLLPDPGEKHFREFNRIKDGFQIPSYCVAGNHDIGGKGDPKYLAMYRDEIGKDYYSFEHKGIAFVGINTQLWKVPVKEETEKHDAWLKATLDACRKNNLQIVVFGHHPVFTKKADEKEHKKNLPVEKRGKILALFNKHGVGVFLTGHTHNRVIREHAGIQLVTAGAISLTGSPEFALWTVRGGAFEYRFVSLSEEITKGPWLVWPSKTSTTIIFESYVGAEAVLRYGEQDKIDRIINVKPCEEITHTAKGSAEKEVVGYLYRATIDDLKPGTEYRYSVEIAGIRTKPTPFTTFPDTPGKFTFIAYGDSRTGAKHHRRVAQNFARHNPAFILHSGDFIMPEEYASWSPQYFEPLRGVIDRIPLLPAIGNHEGNGRSFRRIFHFPEDVPLYYSFDYGNLHVVALDSWTTQSEKERAKMLDWCDKDLKTSKTDWKLVFYHHPSYGTGHKSSTPRPWGREDFVPLFHKHEVDLVVTGHAHNYERFVPMTSNDARDTCVTHIVSGGGGAKLYDPKIHPYHLVTKKAYHYLAVTIDGDAIEIVAHDSKGEEFDRVGWKKRNGKPEPEYLRIAKPREAFGVSP